MNLNAAQLSSGIGALAAKDARETTVTYKSNFAPIQDKAITIPPNVTFSGGKIGIISEDSKDSFARAGEGALFPLFTNFANEKAGEVLRVVGSNETAAANLYDDKTQELSLDEQDWIKALMGQETELLYDEDAAEYLKTEKRELDGKHYRVYKYDSNMDGNFETEISFSEFGANVTIKDENDLTDSTSLSYGSNSITIQPDGRGSYAEYSGYPNSVTNAIYTNTGDYNRAFFIQYDDKGNVVYIRA